MLFRAFRPHENDFADRAHIGEKVLELRVLGEEDKNSGHIMDYSLQLYCCQCALEGICDPKAYINGRDGRGVRAERQSRHNQDAIQDHLHTCCSSTACATPRTKSVFSSLVSSIDTAEVADRDWVVPEGSRGDEFNRMIWRSDKYIVCNVTGVLNFSK